MSNDPNAGNSQNQVPLQVRYETSSTAFANQVLVNATNEEVYLDFSPGLVQGGGQGAVLPVQTRVVMTPAGAFRFYQALGRALANYQIVQNPTSAAASEGGAAPEPATSES